MTARETTSTTVVDSTAAKSGPDGLKALILVAIANGLSLIASILLALPILGLSVYGGGSYLFGLFQVPPGMESHYLAVFGMQSVLAVLGIVGLVMGIIAIVRRRRRSMGIAAVVIAIVVPPVSFGVFWVSAATHLIH